MITIRQSLSDKKWRFHFGRMEDWSFPYNSFKEAAIAAYQQGYDWSYNEW